MKVLEALCRYPESLITFHGRSEEVVSFQDLLKRVEYHLELSQVQSEGPLVLNVASRSSEVLAKLIAGIYSERIIVPAGVYDEEDIVEDLAKGPQEEIDVEKVDLIFYTSGSTGKPKGVTVSREALELGISAVQEALGYSEEDTVACILPWFFDAGLNHILTSICSGSDIVVVPHLMTPITLGKIEKHKVTKLLGVPTLWRSLGASSVSSESVNQLANTGGSLDQGIFDDMKRVFPNAKLIPMYGQTEGFRATISLVGFDPRNPQYAGEDMEGVRTFISNPDNTGLGEIVQEGPLVSQGYWSKKSDKFRDGLLYTGDLGRKGLFVLEVVGRNDEMMKIRGVRVSPFMIESKVPCESVAFQESEVAYLVYESDVEIKNPTNYELEMVRVDSLPRLDNGKVNRKKVRKSVEVRL